MKEGRKVVTVRQYLDSIRFGERSFPWISRLHAALTLLTYYSPFFFLIIVVSRILEIVIGRKKERELYNKHVKLSRLRRRLRRKPSSMLRRFVIHELKSTSRRLTWTWPRYRIDPAPFIPNHLAKKSRSDPSLPTGIHVFIMG